MKFLLVLTILLGVETARAVPRILDADIVRGIKSVQNYVKNPEFETNIANVTDSGAGIISFTTTAPVDNTGSLQIASTLSGEIVKISTRAQQKKLEGQTCVAEFSYTGNATNYKAYVLNVAVNVSGDFPLSNAGAGAVHKLIPFPCQSLNDTVDIAIESTAIAAGTIKVDSAFVGESEHALLPGFTAGSVLFSDGANIVEDNARLFWDAASFRLGINTATPSQALDVSGNAQVSGSIQATGVLRSLAGVEIEDPGAGTFIWSIISPTLAASYSMTLPVDDGTAGQVLSTNGSGVLSWVNQVGGASALTPNTQTANYTVLSADDFIICDTSSNNITLTLPTAVGNDGHVIYIKKIASEFSCIIDGDTTETIDDELTQMLRSKHSAVTIVSDGANWLIL